MNILIISAMEDEIAHLKKAINLTHIDNINLQKVYQVDCQNNIYIMNVGIGKVNAAITVTQMLSKYNIGCVINIGTCGSLSAQLKIGDLLLVNKLAYHDIDITAFNHPIGYVAGIESYDNVHESEEFSRFLDISLSDINNPIIKLLEKYSDACGPLVTGDQFIASNEKKELIKKNMANPLAVDMESCAIVQAVKAYNVTFDKGINIFVLRSISDSADDNSNIDFYEYLSLVTKKYVRLIEELINVQ